jgi:hypothetical protein
LAHEPNGGVIGGLAQTSAQKGVVLECHVHVNLLAPN